MTARDGAAIRVAEIATLDGMRQVEALEREVWAIGDREALPLTMLIATRAAGAILLGAFDGPELAGFVYGFPGIEGGRPTIHSHMLAVKDAYRGRGLGRRLKLAQRERALALGVREMTWTFDPLQALNAHFNVEKLGAVSDRYLVDFYGGAHTSFLLSGGTDRLWARWLLDDERVVRRLGPAEPAQEGTSGGGPSGGVRLDDAPALVEPDAGGAPRLRALPGRAGRALVFVPADVNALRRDDPGLAAAWRDATRAAFLEAFAAGFAVDGFARRARGPNGAYVLRRARGAA